MNFAEWADPEFWRQLLSSDFNRGYAAAIGRRFSKPVTRLTLYSFRLGREIDVPTA